MNQDGQQTKGGQACQGDQALAQGCQAVVGNPIGEVKAKGGEKDGLQDGVVLEVKAPQTQAERPG